MNVGHSPFLFFCPIYIVVTLEVYYLLLNTIQLLLVFNLLGISPELMFLLHLGNELLPLSYAAPCLSYAAP
jgi:hypothetical protein